MAGKCEALHLCVRVCVFAEKRSTLAKTCSGSSRNVLCVARNRNRCGEYISYSYHKKARRDDTRVRVRPSSSFLARLGFAIPVTRRVLLNDAALGEVSMLPRPTTPHEELLAKPNSGHCCKQIYIPPGGTHPYRHLCYNTTDVGIPLKCYLAL